MPRLVSSVGSHFHLVFVRRFVDTCVTCFVFCDGALPPMPTSSVVLLTWVPATVAHLFNPAETTTQGSSRTAATPLPDTDYCQGSAFPLGISVPHTHRNTQPHTKYMARCGAPHSHTTKITRAANTPHTPRTLLRRSPAQPLSPHPPTPIPCRASHRRHLPQCDTAHTRRRANGGSR